MAYTKYFALFLLAITSPSSLAENFNITSDTVTNWGQWGNYQMCPPGTYAEGIQLRTEPFLGIIRDDTAVNAIRIFCGDPFNQSTPVITSAMESFGNWGSVYSCYPGFINGFQLRVEPNLNSGDDTATNNIRMFCSNSGDPNKYVEADGLAFGTWGVSKRCYTDQAVCGLQTQIEYCDTTDDCTSLNNLMMTCCDH